MDELNLSDLKSVKAQTELITRSLVDVNSSMAKTFEKMDALHVELGRRSMETQIPFGNDKKVASLAS